MSEKNDADESQALSQKEEFKTETIGPFTFKKVGQLLIEKPEIDWIVDGLLTKAGISILVGKPKSGKSTLVRQLCLAVSRGADFLGRETKTGPILYFALEEQEALIYQQYLKLGATEKDQIELHIGGFKSDKQVLQKMLEALDIKKPILAVVDTLMLMGRQVENGNDYTQVNAFMRNMREVARKSGTHILCIHHQNKGEARGATSILGSTAFHGAVDNAIMFGGSGNKRTITTSQRGGLPFEETELIFDCLTESYSLGEPIAQITKDNVTKNIIEKLRSSKRPLSTGDIKALVTGKGSLIVEVLKEIREERKDIILVTGEGKPGDPYLYSLRSPIPEPKAEESGTDESAGEL